MGSLKKGRQGKMKSYGWSLVQYPWCFYKKRLMAPIGTEEDHIKTSEENVHIQDKERGLRRNPDNTLTSDL
jgi:hypothetical protein